MSNKATPDQASPAQKPSLAQLLRRKDLWRGHSQAFTEQRHWSSGYTELDQVLLHDGWPLGALVEVCQAKGTQTEWLLFGPVVRHASAEDGYVVLLNPPTQPYVPGLIQQEIDLDKIILVRATQRSDVVASLVEILRASVCRLLLCWEPPQGLSYAELRKCQLAAAEHPGLCVLFRQQRQQHQSSPAILRLSTQLHADYLELNLFKQRGKLRNAQVRLPLPASWQALPLHRQLGQPIHTRPSAKLFNFANRQTDTQP
jgi:protein ImuA